MFDIARNLEKQKKRPQEMKWQKLYRQLLYFIFIILLLLDIIIIPRYKNECDSGYYNNQIY